MKIRKTRKYTSRPDHSLKRLVIYALISIVTIAILYIWGLTLLANLSNFWDSVRGSTDSSPNQENGALAPPRLNTPALYTNKNRISISGYGEPGSTVTLFKNGSSLDDQLVGNDGQFTFKNILLREGTNTFTAKAKNGPGQESADSNSVQVILDTVPPKVIVDQPPDGATTSNQYLTVSGNTEVKATLTVNDQLLVVQPDGRFSGVVTLSAGTNQIIFVATDQAGNVTKITRSVTYYP